jgi:flavin reductase (DIM6/NTAB) family NADH-FMN oxidoreductase RutF
MRNLFGYLHLIFFDMKSLLPSDIPLAELHQNLLGAVGPRPIAFVSTMNAQGQINLAPYSFFNIFSVHPPIAVFSPARRGRDNTTKHTYENAKEHPECVINIVNFEMVEQMSLASTEYPQGINEFVKSGLTPLASDLVAPPRVAESPVQLECKILQVMELGSNGGAGNMVICEIVKIHIKEEVLNNEGKIDPVLMDQVARMGGHWYTRANKGLFQLPQPTTKVAIGFDALPQDIRESQWLTGNEIAQLAGVEVLPDETQVNEYKLIELAELFIAYEGRASELEQHLHLRAKEHLASKGLEAAWMTLLSFNN